MKRILEEFFQLTHNGKIREKAMLTRIAMSAVLVVLCMAAMSITAYAYFSTNITANVSPVQSAVWKITAEPEADVLTENGFYVMDNRAGTEDREYRFLLKKASDATASLGYVKIDIKTDVDNYGAAQTYYSQPIGKFLLSGTMTEDLDRELKIAVPAGKLAYVSFTGEWGTCAKQPVTDESQAISPLFGATVEETTEPETTEPETTVPETTEPETTEVVTEPETTVAPTQPETTEAATEPETTVAVTEPETTEVVIEPETTVAPTQPETTEVATEPETTVAATEPETTEAATEPETTATVTEPKITEAATEPETTETVTEPEITEAITEPETTEA